MVSLQRTLALLTPFVLVAMLHYMRFATFTPSGHENVAGRARAKYSAANFRRRMTSRAAAVGQQVAAAATSRAAAVGQQVAAAATSVASAAADAESAVASAATGATERVTTAWRGQGVGGGAMSSEAAVRRVLDQAGLKASDSEVHGLGEVTTAEAFHRALPPGEAVWLTFSNAAYLHFAQNWYMSVRAIGRQRQVVVAALDVPTLKAWRELKVPVLDYTQFGDSSDFRGIGADQARFRKMGAMKVAAFHQLLKLNRTVLVSDVDTVWTADPQPYLSGLHDVVDIGVTSDCLSREADENKDGRNGRFNPQGVWFCGHNPGNTFGATFNTGVLYLRPTPNAVAFTGRWHAKLLEKTDDWHMEDQRGFNILTMQGFYPTVAAAGVADGSVVRAADKTLNLMPLPARRFCSGHTFFIQQSARRQLCLNVHVTFTEGGVHGKLWRLQEAALWNLHPKGYFDSGRYLTIRPPTIPTPYPPARVEPYEQCERRVAAGGKPDPTYHGWWSPAGAASKCAHETKQYRDKEGETGVRIEEAMAMAPRLQGHMKMAARYLVAMRDGMSIAWLLNRTFVFPRFGCLCDRSEWPDIMPTCRLENSDLAFPFDCPLNFLINVHFMQGVEASNGRYHGVPYREHSFLTNPRLSPAIRDSNATVVFARDFDEDHPPRADGESGGTNPFNFGSVVEVPKGATDVELLRALGPGSKHAHTAALYLDEAEDVLGGFEDADAGRYIRQLLDNKVLYGSWCCSRTNFHRAGATAFFEKPRELPLGAAATQLRTRRGAN